MDSNSLLYLSIPSAELEVTASYTVRIGLGKRAKSECSHADNSQIWLNTLTVPAILRPEEFSAFESLTNSAVGSVKISPTESLICVHLLNLIVENVWWVSGVGAL